MHPLRSCFLIWLSLGLTGSLATARGDHPSVRNNARVMSEMIVPEGPFVSVSLADRRNLGNELAAGVGMVSMVTTMMGASIPEPQVRQAIARLSAIFGKLTPVLQKIDFYKSVSTHIVFDGQMWRTKLVTHYRSPQEQSPDQS